MTTSDWSLPHRSSIPTRISHALYKERFPFLLTLTALLGVGTALTRLPPNVYQSKSTLLIQTPVTAERLSGLNGEPGVGQLPALGDRVSPVDNQVALLESRPVFEEALKQIDPALLKRLNLSVEDVFYSNLAVKAIDKTDLVEISYQSESPELAAEVVQAVVKIYTQQNLSSNRQQGSTARQFLQQRLPELDKRLQAARNELEQFQSGNQFLGTTSETDSITQSLSNFTNQVALARSELAAADQKLAQMRSQLSGNPLNALNAAGVSQDPVYQDLQKQLLEAESQVVDLQNRFTDEDPHLASALARREDIQALLNQRAESLVGQRVSQVAIDPIRQRLVEQWFTLQTERSAQSARLEQLSQQLDLFQSRSSELPQLMERQTQLQLAVELAEQEYRTFQQQFVTSQIAEEQTVSNVRVVEPASVSINPVAPNRKLLLALVIVGSTATALAVVWLRRQRDSTLEEANDLNEILPLPILATVPWSGDGRLNRGAPLEGQPLTHSYRLLQAHLKMLPREIRAIAICSWSPREGRSSVAHNLALLEAKSGHRVLLIDAHRHPLTQSEAWGFSSRQDGSVSKNGSASWQTKLHRIAPNFEVLPHSDVCSTANYKEWLLLLEQARERYDLVILDCPSIAQGADAAMLASLSDGVLWVVCPELLGRQGVEASAQNLRTWSARLLGQVVVGVGQEVVPALPTPNRFLVTSGI